MKFGKFRQSVTRYVISVFIKKIYIQNHKRRHGTPSFEEYMDEKVKEQKGSHEGFDVNEMIKKINKKILELEAKEEKKDGK